jgi:hypothetical protein
MKTIKIQKNHPFGLVTVNNQTIYFAEAGISLEMSNEEIISFFEERYEGEEIEVIFLAENKRNTYKIHEAHSGTSKSEIRAAQRDFRKKYGSNGHKVEIFFKDSNYEISWRFYDIESHQELY